MLQEELDLAKASLESTKLHEIANETKEKK